LTVFQGAGPPRKKRPAAMAGRCFYQLVKKLAPRAVSAARDEFA
jgi:hypothetical protein